VERAPASRSCLAELAQSVVATAWAGRWHRIDNALPRQMLRQRPARRLAALERWHRNLAGCRHLHRGLGLCGVRLEIGELQLELVQQAPRSEDCPNCSCRSFLIVSFSFSISNICAWASASAARRAVRSARSIAFSVVRSSGKDHRRPCQPENHNLPSLSEPPLRGIDSILAISRPPAAATCVAASASQLPSRR